MGAFATIVEVMAEMDVFQLFFPWLLILSISYGILQKSEVIGDDSTVNGVAALSLAFFTIGGSYFFVPAGTFTRFASGLAFLVFAIIGLVVMLGVAGIDLSEYTEIEGNLPALVAIIGFIIIFFGTLAFSLPWGDIFGTGNLMGSGSVFEEIIMPILILIFLIIIVATTTD
jgi:hypothetical protein